MKLIDFFKRIFGRENISKEEIEKVIEPASETANTDNASVNSSEEKLHDEFMNESVISKEISEDRMPEGEEESEDSYLEKTEEEIGKIVEEPIDEKAKFGGDTKIVVPSLRRDARNFIHIDVAKLGLITIERESETIGAYTKLLTKDIALYKSDKNEDRINGIEKKYKMIFVHCMELKNLLSSLNELFYEYLLKNLPDENELKGEIEKELNRSIELIGLLAKAGLYDELFNPEKTDKYKENIESEVHKGEFIKEMEELAKKLSENINDKQKGISAGVLRAFKKLKESNQINRSEN